MLRKIHFPFEMCYNNESCPHGIWNVQRVHFKTVDRLSPVSLESEQNLKLLGFSRHYK